MFDSGIDIEQAFGNDAVMDRTYVRRRRVAGATLLSVTLALGLPAAAHALRSAPAQVRPVAARRYVVQPGDTLWSIATQLEPGRDPRQVVDAVARRNGVPGASLVPGQVLVIPAG